jgi:Dihydroorotate dehydrogenase
MLALSFGPCTLKTRCSDDRKSYDPPLITSVLETPDLVSYDPSCPPEVMVTPDLRDFGGQVPCLVNSIGVPSEKPPVWREIYARIKQDARGKFVAISVMGDGDDARSMISDIVNTVSSARDLQPPFIELNISCPNLEKKSGDLCTEPELVAQLCKKAREALAGTGIPIVAKLPRLPEIMLRPLRESAVLSRAFPTEIQCACGHCEMALRVSGSHRRLP